MCYRTGSTVFEKIKRASQHIREEEEKAPSVVFLMIPDDCFW